MEGGTNGCTHFIMSPPPQADRTAARWHLGQASRGSWPLSGLSSRLSVWLVMLALLLYGAFSFPFPVVYGLGELLIGILLVVVVLFQLPGMLRNIQGGAALGSVIGFAWLISVPTFVGMFRWEWSDVIRDIVPLAYLYLPLLLGFSGQGRGSAEFVVGKLSIAIVACGALFAVRYFVSQGIGLQELGGGVFLINLRYFSYDPTVLFAMVYGFLAGMGALSGRGRRRYIGIGLLVGVSLVAFGSLGGIAQRGPIAIAAVMGVGFFGRAWRVSKRPALGAILIGVMVVVVFWKQMEGIVGIMAEKTQIVGVNGKLEELGTVWRVLSESWQNVLFGIGWGGKYFNSAIGDEVRFSHSVVGFYAIKTGLIGLAAFGLYAIWLARMYWKLLAHAWRKNVMQLPLLFAIGAVLIVAMLQPTYKTLSFGLIASLIPVLRYGGETRVRKGTKRGGGPGAGTAEGYGKPYADVGTWGNSARLGKSRKRVVRKNRGRDWGGVGRVD